MDNSIESKGKVKNICSTVEDYDSVEQPSCLKNVTLFKHQLASLRKAENLESSNIASTIQKVI